MIFLNLLSFSYSFLLKKCILGVSLLGMVYGGYIYLPQFMYWMYRYGPTWLGFWNGRNIEDICVSIVDNAALDSLFWSRNIGKCYELVDNHFKSVYTSWLVLMTLFAILYGLLTLTYFIFLYGISKLLLDPLLSYKKIVYALDGSQGRIAMHENKIHEQY